MHNNLNCSKLVVLITDSERVLHRWVVEGKKELYSYIQTTYQVSWFYHKVHKPAVTCLFVRPN